MKKLLLVFGTRPEAIKMAPVAAALRDAFEMKIVLTGQHEMARDVLTSFDLTPDYDLAIMKERQTLTDIAIGVLEKLPPVYRAEKPDMVLVHGDTSTSFFAGLAAFYERIPVAHVEAGLRTYNRYEPYPEEFNRQAISSLAELHFAPTERAKEHLLDEHIDPATIFVTGNTVIDALMTHVEKTAPADKRTILVTMHRRENVGERMASAFRAFRRIVDDFDVEIVYPVHPSPAVRELAKKNLTHPKIHLVEPMNPIEFYRAMNESFFIATDSGGVQEEAPALGKPVLVLRETTERPEGVEAGTLKLIGTEEDDVYRAMATLLTDEAAYTRMAKAVNPYGDGHASERICAHLLDYFQQKEDA